MPIGYKLFEQKGNKLFPLFIDKSEPVLSGRWMPAKNCPTKGFASRPGWHIGEIPDAPWLKGYDGSDKGCYKSRFRHGRRVWCEVEYRNDTDYTPLAEQTRKGWLEDRVPVNGSYRFKETGNRWWVIAGEMRVVRVLPEDERQLLLDSIGYDEVQAYAKYKKGFERKAETLKLKNRV